MMGALTNHVWQSTLFAIMAGILTLAFRKNQAPVRYWLWFSASFKFFVAFALLMSLGSHLNWGPAATPSATSGFWFPLEQIPRPFSNSEPFVPSAPGSANWIPIAAFCIWACGLTVI